MKERIEDVVKPVEPFAVLRDAPMGTKVYTPMFGYGTLDFVDTALKIIRMKNDDNHYICFDYWGHLYTDAYERYRNVAGECLLFPDRNKRDWHNGWQQYLFAQDNYVTMIMEREVVTYKIILIDTSDDNAFLTVVDTNSNKIAIRKDTMCNYFRFATRKEVEDFNYMKENAEISKRNEEGETTIFNSCEANVNPEILKPFDKVLCAVTRDEDNPNSLDNSWYPLFFSHYSAERNSYYCVGSPIEFKRCILYEDKFKELIEKKDDNGL